MTANKAVNIQNALFNMLPFSQTVAVGTNEIVTRFSMNRNFEKLLSNDLYLSSLYTDTIQGLNIQEYQSQKTYDYGDTIWFNPSNGGTDRYLLKCIIDDNQNNPMMAVNDLSSYVNGLPFFQKYGWYNQNQSIPISSEELGITREIDSKVNEYFERHQDKTDSDGKLIHRFQQISLNESSNDFYDKKLLKNDATNAVYPRKKIFFPSESGRFTTDTITNGIYRKWDNGLIEIDVSYRMGYVGKRDAGGYSVDVISCNTLQLRPSDGSESSFDRTNNMDYFNSIDDLGIFNGSYPFVGKVGNQWHGNRNDHVNVYSAKLDFQEILPTGFKDTNYMVFSSDCMSQRRIYGEDSMSPGTNTVTFCNKSRRSITAVYVTTPASGEREDGYFAKNGCMSSQSFSCRIIGKWK